MKNGKLLIIGDSPTRESGFSRVVQNLAARWAGHWDEIHFWAIGHDGSTPQSREKKKWNKAPFALVMAHPARGVWYDVGNLQALILQIKDGGYSHVFIVQDSFLLIQANFHNTLRQLADEQGIKTVLYCPVDSPLSPGWVDIAECVDDVVAYTDYGRQELAKHLGRVGRWAGPDAIPVIPHGVDRQIYRPLPPETRAEIRKKMGGGWLKPDDIVLINVNVNQRRKDTIRSLHILQELHKRGHDKVKLIMHMSRRTTDQVDLDDIAGQMGINPEWWCHMDSFFSKHQATLPERTLNELYNMCDACITTTLGEGFGLSILEAASAGLMVFAPDHTACRELGQIMGRDFVRLLPLEEYGVSIYVDMSRVRYRTRVDGAADEIEAWIHEGEIGEIFEDSGVSAADPMDTAALRGVALRPRAGLTEGLKDRFSWDLIAGKFREILQSPKGKGRHLYFEFGGGLGDVFNSLFYKNSITLLNTLGPDDKATVALICHNPAASELFTQHPKRKQIDVLNLGYFHGDEENRVNRAEHVLPRMGALDRLPAAIGVNHRFYPWDMDWPVLEKLGIQSAANPKDCTTPTQFIVLAASAGEPNRNLPNDALNIIVDALLTDTSYVVVAVGRSYGRHERTEVECKFTHPRFVNLIDKLSVPGTAKLLEHSIGLVTAHSALNILGWHFGVPQLLLYPPETFQRHFATPDQWSFGATNGRTIHGLFDGFRKESTTVMKAFVDLVERTRLGL